MNVIGVIKLLIFFVGFVIVCEASGLALLKKINIKHNIIALPIGMALFGCLYEILVLPVQYFHLDSSLLKYALIINLIIFIFCGRKEIIGLKNHLSKRDLIILIISIVLFVVKSLDLNIYGGDSTCGDVFFYIPFINNVSVDGVAVNGTSLNIDMTGGITPHINYALYGHMHFLGAISNLLNVRALLTINFFQIWYLLIFYITNIYNIYSMCVEYKLLNNINKYIVLLFLSAMFLPVVSASSWTCTSTTNIMFMSSFLIFYLKDNNKGWLVLFTIFAFQATSIMSSYYLYLLTLLVPYYLYLLINDRFYVKENIYIVSPILFSMMLFFFYEKPKIILAVCVLLLILLILILSKIVNRVRNNNIKYIYSLILIVLVLVFGIKSLSIGNIVSTYDGITVYEQLKTSFLGFVFNTNKIGSLYNLSYLLFGLIIFIYYLINRKPVPYYSIHIVLLFMLFLNPFVAPFLAKILIEIYSRLFTSWINPLFYLLALNGVIDLFKDTNKKYIKIPLVLFLVLNITLNYFINYAKFTVGTISSYKKERNNISFYYKVGRNSYEIGNVIDDYARDNNQKYVSIALPTNLINTIFYSKSALISPVMGSNGITRRFMSTDIYKQQYNEDNYQYAIFFYLLEPYRFFDDWHFENEPENIPDLESLFKNNNVEVFVINKWNNREEQSHYLTDYLNSFSQILLENDDYIICLLK